MELFRMRAGIDLQHIPYQGGGPALTALAGGHVKVGIVALASALPFVRSGKLKALAVTGDRRSRSLPDTPTVAESGLPGFATLQWFAVLAPAGTPTPIISRLHAEIINASRDPGVTERLAAVALEVRTSPTPDDLGRFMKEDLAKWPPIVKAAGVTVD
jgi:tripartite-type tricarboxylate transporter receptor subunit TctC